MIDKEYSRKELLQKIKEYNFSVIELSLYLDTHQYDDRAIKLHNKYSNELEELKDKYQKKYGPLTIYCPAEDDWRWVEEPWPWEGGIK